MNPILSNSADLHQLKTYISYKKTIIVRVCRKKKKKTCLEQAFIKLRSKYQQSQFPLTFLISKVL